jgi:transposase-like protein
VLRLTGIRHEELLELTHLSIRQYQRPNGEVVALLVIAPSKTDRERVIPVSAELFAVPAAIIRRHTRAGLPVPVVTRWDSHEREHSPPLPFLFQRQNGARHAACSMAWVAGLLSRCCAVLAEAHPQFAGITLTPHDFRRLFATDLVNNSLPIHLGAALLGHTNLHVPRHDFWQRSELLVPTLEELIMARPSVLPVEEKVRIVLAVLAGELTTAAAARQAKVSEQSVSNWKRQFIETGRAGLAAGSGKPDRCGPWPLEATPGTMTACRPLSTTRSSGAVLPSPT